MEPACWGIKFKPIIRKVHTEDSKYYLEIIPEVSSLKNFDKIEWKHDNVFYEYTIPLAYKLIVKKDPQNDQRDSIDSLNPMYHSCVDLFHSSLSSTCWASGDVNRIVSDSFVLSNLKTNLDSYCCCTLKDTKPGSMQTVEKRENFMLTQNINETCTATKSTALIEQTRDTLDMTPMETQMNCYHNLINNMVQNFVEEECLFLVAPSLAQENFSRELNNIEQNSEEKGTHISQCVMSSNIGLSDINIDLSDDVVNVEKEIVDERKPCNYMQKLSLSPICSITVNTEPLVTKLPLENENTSLIPYNDPTNKDNLQQNNRWFNDGTRNNVIITAKFNNTEYVQSRVNLEDEPLLRIAPEIRIQYYMNMLRKEVLPLNNMLDDILRKYAALNVRENDFVKTVNGKNIPKTFKMLGGKEVPEKKCIKSNRVVYTIVFDG